VKRTVEESKKEKEKRGKGIGRAKGKTKEKLRGWARATNDLKERQEKELTKRLNIKKREKKGGKQ